MFIKTIFLPCVFYPGLSPHLQSQSGKLHSAHYEEGRRE